MGFSHRAIVGYGIYFKHQEEENFPWYDESRDYDFLEWMSQKTGIHSFDEEADWEEHQKFMAQIPLNLVLSEDFIFLFLTGFYWEHEKYKPLNLSTTLSIYNQEKFEQAREQAISFCQKNGIDFSNANWIIAAVEAF